MVASVFQSNLIIGVEHSSCNNRNTQSVQSLSLETYLHITPTGIHIPRIKAKFGPPEEEGVIDPPFGYTVELMIDMPAIDVPPDRTDVRLLY